MALRESTMLELGSSLPAFSIPDVSSGKNVSKDDLSDKKGLLIIFLCRHCPYVQFIKEELAKLGADYKEKDLAIVGISSNDINNYPEDSPEKLNQFKKETDFKFPILFDESQEVAKSFTASCTPDFFLFNRERKLVYRGQLDDARPGNGKKVTGQDLRSAIEALLNDGTVNPKQKPSIGCNIKWKPGAAPDYF